MALVNENDLTSALRGKFGTQFIFRKLGDKVYASRKPTRRKKKTKAQLAQQERFRRATEYAKKVLLIPEMKADYQAIAASKNFSNPFAVAVRDFMNPIEILSINSELYPTRDLLVFIKLKDFQKVKRMELIVKDLQGHVVSRGDATLDSSHFVYLAKLEATATLPLQIRIEATDRPGNQVVKELILDKSPLTSN